MGGIFAEALCCGGGSLVATVDAAARSLGIAVFCFFFDVSGSADGEAETPSSSSFRFLAVFLPTVDALAVGVLVLLLRDARALEKRFLNADPMSPRRRAACSASCAARAARSRAVSGFLSFLSTFRDVVLDLEGSGVARVGVAGIWATMVSAFSVLG